jgi:hypothetical protein
LDPKAAISAAAADVGTGAEDETAPSNSAVLLSLPTPELGCGWDCAWPGPDSSLPVPWALVAPSPLVWGERSRRIRPCNGGMKSNVCGGGKATACGVVGASLTTGVSGADDFGPGVMAVGDLDDIGEANRRCAPEVSTN